MARIPVLPCDAALFLVKSLGKGRSYIAVASRSEARSMWTAKETPPQRRKQDDVGVGEVNVENVLLTFAIILHARICLPC